MVAAASVVVVAGGVSGVISAAGEGRDAPEARPVASASPRPVPLPAVPSASPSVTVSASPSVEPKRSPSASTGARKERRAVPSARLYRHPASRVLDWVRAHPDDPRRAVIESRIADQPAAVWFADWSPDTVTARVRAVTSGGAAQGGCPSSCRTRSRGGTAAATPRAARRTWAPTTTGSTGSPPGSAAGRSW